MGNGPWVHDRLMRNRHGRVVEDEMLTAKQAGELLKCSKSNLYKLIDVGMLPASKIGEKRGYRIRKSDVCDLLNKNADLILET